MAKPRRRQPAKSASVPPPETDEPTMTPGELYQGMIQGERYKAFETLCDKTDFYTGEEDAEGNDVYVEAFVLPMAQWSERYQPSIDVANHRAYIKYWAPWVKDEISGGSHHAVIPVSELWLMSQKQYDDLYETVEGIKNKDHYYVDEDMHSQVETEQQDKSWDEYYRKEFIEFLTEHIQEDYEGVVDRNGESVAERMIALLPSKVDGIFSELMHNGSGDEWTEDSDGQGWSLNIDRVIADAYVSGIPRGQQRYDYTLRGIYDELYSELYPEDPRQMKFDLPLEVAEALLESAVVLSDDPSPAAKILVSTLLEGHDYSCVLIHLPEELQDLIVAWGKQQIPEESLFVDKDGDKGREDEIHVTVKYGLFDAMPSPLLLDIFKSTKPFEVSLSPITLFRQDDHDVVKLDVHSPQLHELNREVSQACPHHDTFPEYHPHVTIAYVKKGTCDRLEGVSPFDHPVKLGVTTIGTDGKFEAKSVIFSSHANVKREYSLGPTKIVKEEEEPEETVPTMSPADLATQVGLTPWPQRMSTTRRKVGKELVDSVWIDKKPRDTSPLGRSGFGTEGELRIYFRGQRPVIHQYCSWEVLKMVVRQWRNLTGARLFVNGKESGKVIYNNPALQDAPMAD